ncbi:hypothetical protein OSB04_030277, partial [Centaurea solstitialis]
MQLKLATMEEGKEPTINSIRITNQSRGFPMRLLGFLLLFLGIGVGFSIMNLFKIRYFLGTQNGEHNLMEACVVHEPRSLDDWIKPPLSYVHTLDDSELLWRASYVAQVKEYPFKRSPKIAFMFLTRGPLPLSPLWEKFFKGNEEFYSIYIHTTPSYRANFSSSSVFYRKQIPSQVVEWGMMNMCDAERRLLANALLDISNEWFILLSEACIPLQNFKIVYRYISRSRFSFMGAFDEPGPYGRGRYNKNMFPEVRISQWRKGSQWFEVNRKLAVDIITDYKYYQKFEHFCKPDCYVDEHYFPTMLTIQSPHLLANRTLTYVDWSRGGAHPASFGKDDITQEFIRKIQHGHTCLYNNQPTSACYFLQGNLLLMLWCHCYKSLQNCLATDL